MANRQIPLEVFATNWKTDEVSFVSSHEAGTLMVTVEASVGQLCSESGYAAG
jgi:hypothetical protein